MIKKWNIRKHSYSAHHTHKADHLYSVVCSRFPDWFFVFWVKIQREKGLKEPREGNKAVWDTDTLSVMCHVAVWEGQCGRHFASAWLKGLVRDKRCIVQITCLLSDGIEKSWQFTFIVTSGFCQTSRELSSETARMRTSSRLTATKQAVFMWLFICWWENECKLKN